MKQSWYFALGLAVATLCTPLVARQGQSAQVRLEAARKAETIDGNPKAAVAQYEQIVKRFANDRAVVADALVRMAGAYKMLGDAQAKAIYERVVREYGDQVSAVAAARTALSTGAGQTAAASAGSSMVLRRVWGEQGADVTGSVSADGRYLSFTDWVTGDLAIRNLQDGTNRRLTDKGAWADSSEYAERSVFSPDGRSITYGWASRGPQDAYELRVVDLSVSSAPVRRLVVDPTLDFIAPWDWSADGRWIAVMLARKEGPREVGVVDVRSGNLQASFAADGVNAIRFTPDSQGIVFDRMQSGTIVTDIVMRPIAGGTERFLVEGAGRNVPLAWSPGGGLLFASNRGGSQGLWLQDLVAWQPQGSPILVKGDVGMRPIGLTKSGALYIGATASNLEIRLGALETGGSEPALSAGLALESYVGIDMVPAWSRDGASLAFLTRRDRSNRPPVIGIRDMVSGRIRELTPSRRTMNFPRWAADASALYVQGFDMGNKQGLFRVDGRTGELSTVALAGPGAGVWFAMPSPDGRSLYFVRRVGPDNIIVVRDVDGGPEREVARGSGNTPPPALSMEGTHLAMGRTDERSKTSQVLVVPAQGGEPRVVHTEAAPNFIRFISWLPGGTQLLLVRGLDGATGQKVVLVSLDGTPARVVAAPDTVNGPLAVHPDGRQVAYPAGARLDEVWVLENFLPRAKAAK